MNRDADTTLAVLAVLLQTLHGSRIEYGHQSGLSGYKLSYGPGLHSYFFAETLTELAEKGR